jgi:hypothetical protein
VIGCQAGAAADDDLLPHKDIVGAVTRCGFGQAHFVASVLFDSKNG